MFTSGSPNAGQLQIGIALVLQDRFSNQAREASSQIRRLHQDAKNVTNANLNAVKSISMMGTAAGAAALYGLGNVVKEGAQFIDVMTYVNAIADKTGISMDKLSNKAQSLGKATMFDSADIASAMRYFAMAGFNTQQIYNNIAGAANLAGATMTELGGKGGAADIMTNIMSMFRIESTELNASHVADVLSKATNSANTNLYDLAEAIKYAGTTVTNLGGSLEQTAAFIGVLGNAGIQGSMAGTALANTYRYLSRSIGDPNFKGNKALTKLGLSKEDFLDANGRLIDMGLAMQKIAFATRGLNDVDRFNTLVSILGVRGERGGSTMVKAFEDYTKLLDRIQNQSQGNAQMVMTTRMSNLAGSLDKVTSTLENIRTSFTVALEPTLKPILNGLAEIFDWIRAILQTPFIGPFVSTFITFGTVLTTIRVGMVALKSSFRLMFNDSTVTFSNMIAVMKQGWSQASISATQYAAIQEGIIAQQKAGITANASSTFAKSAYMTQMMASPGSYIGGMMYKTDKHGRPMFFSKNAQGGITRVSAKLAEQRIGQMTPKGLGLLKGVVVGAVGSGISSTLLKGGLMKGLGVVLKGALSFLGGPIGIGLSALLFFLPQIISAITGNSDAQNDNTAAINAKKEEERLNNITGGPLTTEEQNVMIANALNNLAETLKGQVVGKVVVNTMGAEQVVEIVRGMEDKEINTTGGK